MGLQSELLLEELALDTSVVVAIELSSLVSSPSLAISVSETTIGRLGVLCHSPCVLVGSRSLLSTSSYM